MNTYAFLYSATATLDYRLIASPGINVIPSSILSMFKKRILGLLSDEASIAQPKWLFVKEYYNENVYVLWGVACQNDAFSSLFSYDTKKRRIQCFTGVAVVNPDDTIKLPYEVELMRGIFNEVMERCWDSMDKQPLEITYSLPDFQDGVYISKRTVNTLNYDPSVCRLFPATHNDSGILFADALSSNRNVSIASNIINNSEVTDSHYLPLLNAVSVKENIVVKDIRVQHECRGCQRPSYDLIDGLCESCRAKNTATEHEASLICSQCGKVYKHLEYGLCDNCYKLSKMMTCKECGKKVEFIHPDGRCDDCRTIILKRKRRIVLITFLMLIAAILIVKKYDLPHMNIIDKIKNSYIFNRKV